MFRKMLPSFLVLVLATLACSVDFNLTATPPAEATPAPSLPPPAGPLTEDMLQNATYLSPFTGRSITLVDGIYQSGPDSSAADFLQARLDAPITFGDLDYDGLADAAVLLAENTGGTGVFVSMIAVLNRDGSPLPVASIFIEDRPMINSLVIQSGEVLLDAVLHGASDPMCCPTRQVWEGYRLYNENTLVLSRWAEMIPGVGPRQVDLTSPVDLETVSYPFTIFGGVTMWPFENTLAWNVYAPDNAFVTGGSVMTDAADIGEPGNFTLDLDLTMAGVTGLVRVEFVEYSMADGSVMTLDSVLVNIP